jgi:hypothetical protein
MTKTDDLKELASSTLEYFDLASAQADEALRTGRPPTADVFANVNTLTGTNATQTLADISEEQRADWRTLTSEPAIARVLVRDDGDRPSIIYVTRGSVPRLNIAGVKVASYRSPMGRLAALSIGAEEEIRLPGGSAHYLVSEKAALRPIRPDGHWDGKDTVLHRKNAAPVTIGSLRALIGDGQAGADLGDILDSLLQQDDAAQNVREGIIRSVIEKMGLRDRPLLDQYQDEIYRLPLGSRLAIMGPPGSGKTTTLIKRLGLKLDLEYLDEEERDDVEGTLAGQAGHATSWLMFTPSELLKLYIKEAFARENIAAPDQRIRTWDEMRREMGRQSLGFLQTGTSSGAIMRLQDKLLKPDVLSRSTEWFEDFFEWQDAFYWTGLDQYAERLAASDDLQTRKAGNDIKAVLARKAKGVAISSLGGLLGATSPVSDLLSRLRADINARLDNAFRERLKANPQLLNQLLEFMKGLEVSQEDAEDEIDEADTEDDETIAPLVRLQDALEAYKRAVRSQARAAATGRKPSARSRNGQVLGWLGPNALAEAQAKEIGSSILLMDALSRFANPIDHYVSRIARRYRAFRKDRQANGMWYEAVSVPSNELDPLEVDVVILAILRSSAALLRDSQIGRRLQDARYPVLETVRSLYRNQVIVDEATDFSPIQLACMAGMCDPALNSFVACGDFNQRLTRWGSRNTEELSWAIPSIDVRSILITYRHSRQLNEFSSRLIELSGGAADQSAMPEHLATEGFDPVLGMSLTGDALADWLAARILEIEGHNKTLPSIAILVNDERRLDEIADALNRRLEARQNVRCVACPKGQVRGQDNDVRVFDVQHIKGLEFEAVFFVDVDRLAEDQEELFYKYLYVGATRAATYLGLSCGSETLPAQLAPLADGFQKSWGQ